MSPRAIPDSACSSQVVSGPMVPEVYAGMIFGWRPPASCYGYGSKTPQQQDAGQKSCGMGGGAFLGLLAGAALVGLAMRKGK